MPVIDHGEDDPHIQRNVWIPGELNPDRITQRDWDAFQANKTRVQRGMWTDGGHWMGSGPEPDAFAKLEARQPSIVNLYWPTNGCVAKYRRQSQEAKQKMGYVAGALAAIATQGRSLRASLGSGFGAAWLVNRLDGIPLHRGWRLEISTTTWISIGTHPRLSRDAMGVTRADRLFDENGQLVETKEWGDERSLESLRDDIVFDLLMTLSERSSMRLDITCPNVTLTPLAQ